MTTQFQDLERSNPELADAYRVTGNQPRWALKNMIAALSMMSALNTPEENQRLLAAKYILRHTKAA